LRTVELHIQQEKSQQRDNTHVMTYSGHYCHYFWGSQ